jgi:Peptidyl-prolyl cis-trans isomerase (rotamase) - cyclophilin family
MLKKLFSQTSISKPVFALLLIITLTGMMTDAQATVVRVQTSLGIIDVRLFDSETPLTVANFLKYVDSGAYNRSLIHRSVPGFAVHVIQGGGISLAGANNSLGPIAANPPVTNEYSSSRSNMRGTIAMAKVAGDANSATSQWFFNLVDNSQFLDERNNGGFTVFGQVIEKGMSVADAIGGLPLLSSSPQYDAIIAATPFFASFKELPLATPATGSSLQTNNLVLISTITSNRSSTPVSDSDRLFSYLEGAYPEYLSPANPLSSTTPISATASGYYYRYYPASKAYIGTANETVYYLGPLSQNQVITLGSLSDWLKTAATAGY